jgi:hypothetical protein
MVVARHGFLAAFFWVAGRDREGLPIVRVLDMLVGFGFLYNKNQLGIF